MAGEWRSLTLRDAGVMLIDCEHRTPPAASAGFPYVAIPQIKAGRLELSDARRISPEHFSEWTRKANPQTHDVILSRRCNPGETGFVPPGLQCALGQNLVLLRADATKVYPPFLRWLVRGDEWWEQIRKFLNVGAVFDSLKCADIPNFRLLIPPLEDQNAIASMLGALDAKIELNRRMNETLEAIARAIFKSRFFERTSQVRPITKVGEVAEIIKGRSYKSEELVETGDTALVTLKSFERGGGYKADGLKGFAGPFKPEQQVSPGEVVIALTDVTQNAEVIGRPALVRGSARFSKLVASLDTAIVRPRNIVGNQFLYCLFRTQEFADHTYAHCSGTTVLHLGKEAIPSFSFPKPEERDASTFEQVVTPMFDRIAHNELENANLSAIRGALLPKLMSGEIRIKQAEKMVEAHA